MCVVTRYAAIDVGTNTVRFLVCDEKLQHLDRGSRITRLGTGVDASGLLDGAAMERTLDAITTFAARARELGADPIRIAGTSALRDAGNGAEFLSAVRDATSLEVEILAGSSEGRCAYAGATGWLDAGEYVVCDIGGGSTELITAAHAVSVDVGSVRVKERFFSTDPPKPNEIEAAREYVRDAIAARLGEVALGGSEQLVGVAGTITTVAALVLGLWTYDRERVHGSRLTRADVDAWSARLLATSSGEIAEIGPVAPGREDVIGSGSLILSVVMEVLDADNVLVSERDILDGLVAELVG
jgi:exopolyphosphatase/guanosine-5'-triphosphate,3'-diphosphate pyrophosphatase